MPRQRNVRHAPVGYRIREQRRALGITQAGFAKRVGISAPYMNLIEANRRPVGGALLGRIAAELGVDSDSLTGVRERRRMDELGELSADPLLLQLRLEPEFAEEIVGRFPNWSRAILALYRAYLDSSANVAALSDRLNRDPLVGDAVHRMLTHITSIRSSAEILDETDDLDPVQQRRFHSVISSESARLSDVAQSLIEFFGEAHGSGSSLTAADEVDDFFIDHRAHFPGLEEAAAALRARAIATGGTVEGALVDHLGADFGVTVSRVSAAETDLSGFRNQCMFEPGSRRLSFLDSAAGATRRFQLARLAAELGCRDSIVETLDGAGLSTSAARERALRALAAYVAGAALLPYDSFHADAERLRYDVELLRHAYDASFEQICHRLITLRRPSAEAIPFAFARADASGYIVKRFPLPGLPLARHGHACPLWSLYSAFQAPGRVVRQYGELPDGNRFLLVSRAVARPPATFRDAPFVFSVMLACDILHADRTVYADGLDLQTTGSPAPIGPSCRLCSRSGCLHRAEAPLAQVATQT